MAGERILVVDDEVPIRRLIQVNLEKVGYEVETARDGTEALVKVRAEKPDLIVLDVMMPQMDGYEVLKRLQANSETREIPVVMLTAKAQDEDVLRGWSAGVSAYLTKPFNPLELIAFIKRIMSSWEEEEEQVWEV